MNRFIDTIRSKYFIAGIAYLVWMLFFDRYDINTQYNYQKEKNKLEDEKEFYSAEIDRITTSIIEVKNDPDVIQKIAREKYKMKKENEDIFIIVPAAVEEK